MFTVREIFEASYEVKRSQFIAFLTPTEKFKTVHERLKKEHPKANHIVWAKRYLNEFEQIVENFSDDGEPKGTSGMPVLNVLRGEKLINSSFLIVRYFGGIKLGTGGIARAYSSAAKEVLGKSSLIPYQKILLFEFEIPYTMIQHLEYYLKKEMIDFGNRIFLNDKIKWELSVTKSQKEKLEKFLEKNRH